MEFDEEEELKILPCSHQFHSKCIVTWLEKVNWHCLLTCGGLILQDWTGSSGYLLKHKSTHTQTHTHTHLASLVCWGSGAEVSSVCVCMCVCVYVCVSAKGSACYKLRLSLLPFAQQFTSEMGGPICWLLLTQGRKGCRGGGGGVHLLAAVKQHGALTGRVETWCLR